MDGAVWVRPGKARKRIVKAKRTVEEGGASESEAESEEAKEEEVDEDDKLELGWPEKRICLNARNKLLLIQNAHALAIVRHQRPNDAPKCTGDDDGAKCHRTRLRIADILTRWGTAGFLDFFDEQYEAFASDFCETCRTDFKATHAQAVQELWDVLPKVCGFEGGWRELERVRGLCTA